MTMTKIKDEKIEAIADNAVKLGDTLAAISGGDTPAQAVRAADLKAQLDKLAAAKSAKAQEDAATKEQKDEPEPKTEPTPKQAGLAPSVTVSANANKVHFGRDQYGLTQKLRKEGLAAAGRVQGSEAKLRTLVHTLNILRDHAIARYKRQLGVKKDLAAKVTERELNERKVREQQKAAAIAAAEAHLKALKGE